MGHSSPRGSVKAKRQPSPRGVASETRGFGGLVPHAVAGFQVVCCAEGTYWGAQRATQYTPGDTRGTPLVGGWVGLEALGILTRMGRDLGSVVLPEYMNGLQNFSPTRPSAKSEKRSVFVDFSGVNNRLKESQKRTPHARPRGTPNSFAEWGCKGQSPCLADV